MDFKQWTQIDPYYFCCYLIHEFKWRHGYKKQIFTGAWQTATILAGQPRISVTGASYKQLCHTLQPGDFYLGLRHYLGPIGYNFENGYRKALRGVTGYAAAQTAYGCQPCDAEAQSFSYFDRHAQQIGRVLPLIENQTLEVFAGIADDAHDTGLFIMATSDQQAYLARQLLQRPALQTLV